MSHWNFSNLAFSTNCVMNFLFTQNIIVARFARSVEWDFFVISNTVSSCSTAAAVKFSKKKVSPSTLVMLNNLVKKVHWSLFSPQYSWVSESFSVYFKISSKNEREGFCCLDFQTGVVVVRVKLNEISSQTHHWILITSFGQACYTLGSQLLLA